MAGSSNALDVSAPIMYDLKFMTASNVNVSNFVSIKLSGRSNYDIWKAQMLCLIKSQVLLHIIDAKNPFPEDKGVHMIEQYNELVKGWIFGSVIEKVLKDLVHSATAQELWMKLESLFNLPASGTEGDSSSNAAVDVINAPVNSAIREDLKYIQALNANVSNFVSLKLSFWHSDYYKWKTEMLNLIESHELLHIIHAEARFPWDEADPMTKKYDNLVRSWILSTMNQQVLFRFRNYQSVQLMWRNIELTFTDGEGGLSNKSGDVKYMQVSNVNVSNFVSEKLSGGSNYNIWRAQMLRLIESHDLLQYLLHDHLGNKYDDLVKDWISRTMEGEHYLPRYGSAKYVWEVLESRYKDVESIVSATRSRDMEYMRASNVNVSSFVSVKLSGHSNYKIWKAQILCLIQSQELLHIIDTKSRYFGELDTLVKGWIFSTMNEQLLKDFTYPDNLVDNSNSAKDVWEKLQSALDTDRDREDGAPPEFRFIFRTESVRDIPEIENTSSINKELYEAAVEGCWWKAKSILKIHKKAATQAITANGDTILHVAVEMGHNYFVEKLLEFIKDGKDIETQNSKGRTALHIAAAVDNTHTVQLLVQRRIQLLQIQDCNEDSPFDLAYNSLKINTCAYLLKSDLPSGLKSLSHGRSYIKVAIHLAIFAKEYDLAHKLLEKFPEKIDEDILLALTLIFPTDLGFIESFIYPSFSSVRQETIVRCSLIFYPKFLDKCVDDIFRVVKICNNTRSSWLGKISMILFVPIATLYSIYQLICLLILLFRLPFSMLYFHMWKVFAVTVRPVKNIEKKKKDYKEAKKILSLICNQMGTSNDVYKDPLFEAVRQDNYEVVDEILFTSPATINCKDEEGYNIIQLAIINRAEKVYNLLYHIIEHTESYRKMRDSSENSLVHLVGRLAPSFVLGRTTGAALQLQRELLWHEEVKKLFLPIELKQNNIYKETPAMVFTKEHQELMKQGENWMKTTAESCSITTALIITIVFAAAITVPGGSNQESGIPLFKKEIAFTIFAVSNAFSLFTATTGLLLFLSILTTRFSEKDFLVSLPRRLIFGLFMLFISTTTMIVAFCAILFLVFCDQRPWMLAPIAGIACLPISVIVCIKLPLLVELIQSTYFPIFGKKSYLDSCKINRKNTIFSWDD